MTERRGSVGEPTTDDRSDHQLAGAVASEAGRLLMRLRAELRDRDATTLRTAGDRQAHALIRDRLRELRPLDALLSEEGVDDRSRLSADRVWIVDPLDGTREFAEAGRTDWAVHVALWSGDLVAGAVALPARAVTLTTGGERRPVGDPSRRMVVSRSRPPPFVAMVADRLGLQLVEMGSAGAKAMAVVLGDADVYVHAGGQYEWDSAAPAAVARWHGLHVSRIDGSRPRYNQADPKLPDLVVCRPELAGAVLDAIAVAA